MPWKRELTEKQCGMMEYHATTSEIAYMSSFQVGELTKEIPNKAMMQVGMAFANATHFDELIINGYREVDEAYPEKLILRVAATPHVLMLPHPDVQYITGIKFEAAGVRKEEKGSHSKRLRREQVAATPTTPACTDAFDHQVLTQSIASVRVTEVFEPEKDDGPTTKVYFAYWKKKTPNVRFDSAYISPWPTIFLESVRNLTDEEFRQRVETYRRSLQDEFLHALQGKITEDYTTRTSEAWDQLCLMRGCLMKLPVPTEITNMQDLFSALGFVRQWIAAVDDIHAAMIKAWTNGGAKAKEIVNAFRERLREFRAKELSRPMLVLSWKKAVAEVVNRKRPRTDDTQTVEQSSKPSNNNPGPRHPPAYEYGQPPPAAPYMYHPPAYDMWPHHQRAPLYAPPHRGRGDPVRGDHERGKRHGRRGRR